MQVVNKNNKFHIKDGNEKSNPRSKLAMRIPIPACKAVTEK